jgi:hypothetical protein
VFDAIFGIILPLICLAADPVLFEDPLVMVADGLLPRAWRPAVLGLVAWSIAGLVLHLAIRRPGAWRILLLPGHLMGVMTSIVIAAVLFPMAVIGTMMIIGLLGFVPILTAIVYARAFADTAGALGPKAGKWGVVTACVVCVLVLAPLIVLDRWHVPPERKVVARVMPKLIEDATEDDLRVALELARNTTSSLARDVHGPILEEYEALPEGGPERATWARLYKEILGRDIEDDLAFFSD